MDEKKIISAEKANVEDAKDISSEGKTSEPVTGATTQANKKAASSTADQDLDVFLLGEESDEGPGTLFTISRFCHLVWGVIVFNLFVEIRKGTVHHPSLLSALSHQRKQREE